MIRHRHTHKTERQGKNVAEDWSCTGYELAAIREELRERQLVRAASHAGAERPGVRLGVFRLSC